jgi:hypothetical protein
MSIEKLKYVVDLENEVKEMKKDMVTMIESMTCGYFIENDGYGKDNLEFRKDTNEKAKQAMNNLNSILLKYTI